MEIIQMKWDNQTTAVVVIATAVIAFAVAGKSVAKLSRAMSGSFFLQQRTDLFLDSFSIPCNCDWCLAPLT